MRNLLILTVYWKSPMLLIHYLFIIYVHEYATCVSFHVINMPFVPESQEKIIYITGEISSYYWLLLLNQIERGCCPLLLRQRGMLYHTRSRRLNWCSGIRHFISPPDSNHWFLFRHQPKAAIEWFLMRWYHAALWRGCPRTRWQSRDVSRQFFVYFTTRALYFTYNFPYTSDQRFTIIKPAVDHDPSGYPCRCWTCMGGGGSRTNVRS